MEKEYLEIHEVLRILDIEADFIYMLEEEEIICTYCPEGSSKKLLPAQALEEIRVAKVLMEDLGVNLEGVDIILRMRREMINMQRQFHAILEDLKGFVRSLDKSP